MTSILQRCKRLVFDEDGPTTVEYGVMLALIVAVVIATVAVIGTKTSELFEDVSEGFDQ